MADEKEAKKPAAKKAEGAAAKKPAAPKAEAAAKKDTAPKAASKKGAPAEYREQHTRVKRMAHV